MWTHAFGNIETMCNSISSTKKYNILLQNYHTHAVIHLMHLLLNTRISEVHLQSIGLTIFLINIDMYDKLQQPLLFIRSAVFA